MNSSILRPGLMAIVLAGVLAQFGCGGSNSVSGPTPPPTTGSAADVTISIVGERGNQSFSPASATVTVGQTVAFKNNDSTTHRIRANSGAFDTGNLAPGATSGPITINSAAAIPYFCSIHPTMVGTINGAAPQNPGGDY